MKLTSVNNYTPLLYCTILTLFFYYRTDVNTEICDLALNENQPQEDGPETADEEVIF